MDKLEKINIFLNRLAIIKIEAILGEVATGLGVSWLILLVLEVLRPGLVSLYLDLNLILVLALISKSLSIIGKINFK